MGSNKSKSESPSPEDNIFISYYCDHLVSQKKINVSSPVKSIEKESLKNVYDFRKNSIKKDSNLQAIISKNKI